MVCVSWHFEDAQYKTASPPKMQNIIKKWVPTILHMSPVPLFRNRLSRNRKYPTLPLGPGTHWSQPDPHPEQVKRPGRATDQFSPRTIGGGRCTTVCGHAIFNRVLRYSAWRYTLNIHICRIRDICAVAFAEWCLHHLCCSACLGASPALQRPRH